MSGKLPTRQTSSAQPAEEKRGSLRWVRSVLGRSIRLDPATGKILGDEEAARLSIPEYRAPWKFPAQYLG